MTSLVQTTKIVFVENVLAAVDKKMGFEEAKEFSYFLCSTKFK